MSISTRAAARWIGFDLGLAAGNRQAIGARVQVIAGDRRQVEEVRGSSSYAAWHDLRLVFGLGEAEAVERAVIRWPDGEEQVVEGPAVGQYHRLERSP